MARFRFRLQKVLDLRAREEDEARQALAAKTGEVTACQRTLEDLHRRQRASLPASGTGTLNVTHLAAGEAFRRRLTKEIEDAEVRLARLTVEREDLLAVWTEKRQRKEVLVKLEDRRRLEFRKAEEKKEALRQDDLNTAAFLRKMRPVEEPIG